MSLQGVVMVNHLLLHRVLVIVTRSASIRASLRSTFSDPIALPVQNPPARLLGVAKHQVDRAGEKSTAIHPQRGEVIDVPPAKTCVGGTTKGLNEILGAHMAHRQIKAQLMDALLQAQLAEL